MALHYRTAEERKDESKENANARNQRFLISGAGVETSEENTETKRIKERERGGREGRRPGAERVSRETREEGRERKETGGGRCSF